MVAPAEHQHLVDVWRARGVLALAGELGPGSQEARTQLESYEGLCRPRLLPVESAVRLDGDVTLRQGNDRVQVVDQLDDEAARGHRRARVGDDDRHRNGLSRPAVDLLGPDLLDLELGVSDSRDAHGRHSRQSCDGSDTHDIPPSCRAGG
jgi:hypothetical protein